MAKSDQVDSGVNASRDIFALVFAVVFPTIVTLVYFQWLRHSESSIQQVAYGIGKSLQFGFPVFYAWLYYRSKFYRSKFSRFKTELEITEPRNDKKSGRQFLLIGIGFGILVGIAMFALYFLVLAESEVANKLQVLVTEKIHSVGAGVVWKYALLGIFYALCHSFLEEYYWRWFVFDLLRKHTSVWLANVISSLGFMAHHVVLLGFFFGWDSPLAYLFSFSVAIGGSVWAWMYHNENSLRNAWISHMIVDAAIFGLGYFLVFA